MFLHKSNIHPLDLTRTRKQPSTVPLYRSWRIEDLQDRSTPHYPHHETKDFLSGVTIGLKRFWVVQEAALCRLKSPIGAGRRQDELQGRGCEALC